MAFNQLVKKSYAAGATQAFAAPWAAYKGSLIALNGAVAGTVTSTAGLVIPCAGPSYNIEWESLVANVQTVLATAGLVATGIWQVSNDATNWATLYGVNSPAYVAVAPAGAGTTTYCHAFAGINPGHPYLRFAILNTVQTGAAGDNVTVSYNWRGRSYV